jgi:hypothetical protein
MEQLTQGANGNVTAFTDHVTETSHGVMRRTERAGQGVPTGRRFRNPYLASNHP